MHTCVTLRPHVANRCAHVHTKCTKMHVFNNTYFAKNSQNGLSYRAGDTFLPFWVRKKMHKNAIGFRMVKMRKKNALVWYHFVHTRAHSCTRSYVLRAGEMTLPPHQNRKNRTSYGKNITKNGHFFVDFLIFEKFIAKNGITNCPAINLKNMGVKKMMHFWCQRVKFHPLASQILESPVLIAYRRNCTCSCDAPRKMGFIAYGQKSKKTLFFHFFRFRHFRMYTILSKKHLAVADLKKF